MVSDLQLASITSGSSDMNGPGSIEMTTTNRSGGRGDVGATRASAEITVVDVLGVIRSYRWLLVASVLLLGSLGGIYAALKTPLYSAKVIVIPAKAEGNSGLASRLAGSLGGLMSLANVDLGAATGKDEAIAVLKSRQFTEAFIRDRNLLPELFPDSWDPDTQRWVDPENAPTMGKAFARFDQHIRFVSEDEETGLLTLEIIWRDPEQAADWANDLIVRLNQRTREIAIDESEKSLRFLHEQLNGTDIVELRTVMFGLVEQHINRIMLAKIRDEYAFRVIDPAVPAEVDEQVSPRPLLIVSLASVLGFMVGLLVAFVRYFLVNSRQGSGI